MTDIHSIQRMLERRKELRKASTQQENILWQELRNSKLGFKFKRQHSVGGYIADFYCAEVRLIIEIDGSSHDTADQKEYDKFRDEFLKELNHKVLRFKNSQINNELSNVLDEIKSNLNPSPSLGEG
jgi:very-short-patch-repair endonuclease